MGRCACDWASSVLPRTPGQVVHTLPSSGDPSEAGSGTLGSAYRSPSTILHPSMGADPLTSACQPRLRGEGHGRSPGCGPEGGDITSQIQSSPAHLCPPWHETNVGEAVPALSAVTPGTRRAQGRPIASSVGIGPGLRHAPSDAPTSPLGPTVQDPHIFVRSPPFAPLDRCWWPSVLRGGNRSWERVAKLFPVEMCKCLAST